MSPKRVVHGKVPWRFLCAVSHKQPRVRQGFHLAREGRQVHTNLRRHIGKRHLLFDDVLEDCVSFDLTDEGFDREKR